MAQNKKMYDNKATVMYSCPRHVLTKRPFFQLMQRILHVTSRYSPLKAVTIVSAKGGSLHSRGLGNSLNIRPIRI